MKVRKGLKEKQRTSSSKQPVSIVVMNSSPVNRASSPRSVKANDHRAGVDIA